MNKKLIAAAIAAAVAAPAAYADATVYGQLKMQVNMLDGTVDTDMSSKGSRLGFKGSEDLGNGMKAHFKLEYGLNMSNGSDTGTAATDSVWSSRSQYVGIAGNFGNIMLGKRETNYLLSTAKLDLFGDTLADYNNILDFEEHGGTNVDGGSRPNNAVHYVSPSFSGVTVAAGLYTDATGDFAEDWDASIVYSNGGIHASAAYITDETSVNSGDAYRLGLGYKMDAIQVNAIYEDNKDGDKIWQIQGAYTMGNNTVKAAFGDNDNAARGNAWAIGVDHKLSKRSKVYALYADTDNTTAGLNADNLGGATSGFSLGMQHNF